MDKKILLDTNIIIHRETNSPIRQDIGELFHWIDKLKDQKYIHPLTESEINKHKDPKIRNSFRIKLSSYNVLVGTDLCADIKNSFDTLDKNENDRNDTKLLNEVYLGTVDFLITEDVRIHKKARDIGLGHKIFFIESYIEKSTIENPALITYKTSAIKHEFFGKVNLDNSFFDSFKKDYNGFEAWFRKKSDEKAYICELNGAITAFLYLKIEDGNTSYHDIYPHFLPKKRLKIGTFKVVLNGFRIGERFLKIIFDNAFKSNVEEIYVTIFNNTPERERLVRLLSRFGFQKHGEKKTSSGTEDVFVRVLSRKYDSNKPLSSYPYISKSGKKFLVPIIPEYHTKLLPDSILNNENPQDFQENTTFGNAILKSYISHSRERGIKKGDILVFYRTGGLYKSVITTIGVVENVELKFTGYQDFMDKCGKRSVFQEKELLSLWNKYYGCKPFVTNFMYVYSFPKRINLKKMIELQIIKDIDSAPRGFQEISDHSFDNLIKETETNPYFLI